MSSAASCRTRSARARTSRTARWTSSSPRAPIPSGHPYSWDTIGSMEDLNAASLEDVKDWFRTYYGAANAVLVIAGDITAARGEDRRSSSISATSRPARLIKRQEAWIAKMSGEKRAMMQDRVPQARIYKTWNIPGYTHARLRAARSRVGHPRQRQEQPPLQAPGLQGSDRHGRAGGRRAVRDRLAAADDRDREAGRRSRARSRRRSTRSWRRSCARARRRRSSSASRTAGYAELRARHRAHRRLRRQVVHPRARARCSAARRISTRRDLQLAARSHAGGRAERRAAVALGRRVRAQRASRRRNTTSRRAGADRSKLPATGTPPDLKLPPLAADDAVERPEGRAGRAAQRAGRRHDADRRCRLCGGQPRDAGHGEARARHDPTRARRRATRCRSPSARESLGAQHRRGLFARYLVHLS